MTSTFTRAVLLLALVPFAPAIVAGAGFVLAGVLAVGVLVGGFGGRFTADIIRNREFGAKSGQRASDLRDHVGGGNNNGNYEREN